VTFEEVLTQAIAMLQRLGRVSYRALKRQFALDDAFLEDLKYELTEVQQLAVDHDGTVLVWTGDASTALAPMPVPVTSAAVSPTTMRRAQEPLAYTPPYLAEKILTSRTAPAGERKQVTVLFADLKGSLELLVADRDPEEVRQLLDPMLERMMAAVHRYEGTVNDVMGDGIMALFGAPIAHEDHAVRACYAALAMQESIRRYSEEVRRMHGVEVQIRVGLNSGEVVVRAIANDFHMDYSAIGQTTHLAARMEQLAPPGTIRLTADTLRLAEGWIQVTPLGPVPVKGLSDPVEVCELVGAGPARTRLQAFAARGLTPFVGRQAELATLHQALEQAEAGHGQVVAVIGEPGVGKTRLFHEFTHASRTQGWLLLESSSTSYGKATPYLPIIDLLKAYFQIEDRDDGRRVREKLTGRLLTLDPILGPTLPAFLALLEVPIEDPAWQALDPAQRRQRTLDALRRLLLRESQVQPLLLVFENLHWIDAETQAFLDGLVESLPAARLLLLVNYRSEYQHGWGTKTCYTQLRLDPLPPASAEALLQRLLGDDAGLEPLKQRLIERTQGNPFFLEESVRTLVETQGLVGTPGAYRLARALPSIQVPATVQAVLAARIDRLPPEEKQLLQTAAVIGTEVPLALLQAIAEVPEAPLRLSLAHLQAAEFLYETRLFPEHEYTFKHALTQQVAYETLLQERRRALHACIVEALEALVGDRVTEQVERLAHHALRGEVWDKALAYLRQAGDKAMARSAHYEAVGSFEQALVALQHLPENRDTLAQAIDLRLELRNPLLAFGELDRILTYLREAEAFAEALGDHRRLGWVSARMANHFWQGGDYDRALTLAQRTLTLAISSRDTALQATAHWYMGAVSNHLGDYRRAIDCLERAVALLEGELRHVRLALGLTSVLSRGYLTRCLAEVGRFAEGLVRGEEGIQIAEAVDNAFSRTEVYRSVGLLYLRKGEIRKALPFVERAFTLHKVAHLPAFFSRVAMALGAAYALSGRIAEALPLLEQAVEQAETTHFMAEHTLSVTYLSEAYLLTGRLEEARQLAGQALELSRERKERGKEAWILRLLGEIAVRCEPSASTQAEDYYRQTLTLAEELGMRPLQAHCHLGLGTLYAMSGQREQARTVLSTAIALYRDMDMTFWLPQAEAALGQVEA
jgi:class 3 adenylate cyclase/tetratricopeptide (TPR) repeat protein